MASIVTKAVFERSLRAEMRILRQPTATSRDRGIFRSTKRSYIINHLSVDSNGPIFDLFMGAKTNRLCDLVDRLPGYRS
jgi:hypothetical protein